MRIVLLVFGAALILLLSACETEVPYRECIFDSKLEEFCYETGSFGKLTCVADDHPDCVNRVCLSYQGSTYFCSQSCTTDADCPRNGCCALFLHDRYCVASELEPGNCASVTSE
jgi:hypothetical protein